VSAKAATTEADKKSKSYNELGFRRCELLSRQKLPNRFGASRKPATASLKCRTCFTLLALTIDSLNLMH